MSSASLLEKVPQPWAALVRPFLQRSHEFEDKEPLVAYYLRTHVAFLCMRQRSKEDKEGTAFLMTLLDALEASKARLGTQLQGVDGRTVLTKFALMLFARADDAERTGNASMAIVRLFYTASVLFEATAQFTDDGAMDSVAAQKSKYAKYIATRMKKALDKNEPYVSPNKLEAADDDAAGGVGSVNGAAQTNTFTTAPASCFMQPASQPTSVSNRAPAPSTAHENLPAPPYTPPPATQKLDTPPPPYTQDADTQGRSKTPVQPSLMNNMYAPPQPQHPSQQQQRLSTSSAVPSLPPQSSSAQQRYAASPSASGGVGATGFKPSVDQMIDAQKLASQAVSALQFYDYENAKQQLVASLRVLNGVQ
ncbi:Vta1 like family protein [Leishmania donovani]|nr:Vta1 like family protein [Leishmania donovani]